MPHTIVAAANVTELKTVIRDFAVTNGWVASDDTLSSGGTVKLTKFGHSWYLRSSVEQQFDNAIGANINDTLVGIGVDSDANEPQCRARMNDCTGPMPSVYLFTNAAKTYVHIIVQTSALRYSQLSFGLMDQRGLTDKNVAYAAGNYYVYWFTRSDYVTNPGNGDNAAWNPGVGGFHWHGLVGHTNGTNGTGTYGLRYSVEPGILDPSLGFPASYTDGPGSAVYRTCYMITQYDPASNYNSTLWNDYFATVNNQGITGGIPLVNIPFFIAGTSDARTFCGEFPDLRMVNLQGMSPGQTITLGEDVWQVFPLKQKGNPDNCVGGPTPQPIVNSGDYGFAIKVID